MARRFRRSRRRRTRRSRPRRFRKTLSLAQVTRMGKRFFKLSVASSLSSTVGGLLSFEAVNTPSGLTEWGSITSLFDSYRIAATKVKFIPDRPNDSSLTTGYRPIYVFADVDSTTNPIATPDQALQYENCKVKNLYMPWSYYFKWPRYTAAGSGGVWFSGGYQDIASLIASGGIYGVAASGLDASKQYGTLVIRHYIVVKNRR